MRWVTREKVKVDRVACPWLIKEFIDPEAEFVFVPRDTDPASIRDGIPFDMAGVELGHREGRCSFESILLKYGLSDPALHEMAKIIHAADIAADEDLVPEGKGLKAIATGFSLLGLSDHQILEKEFIVYDALYRFCQEKVHK